jgi:hypothetical protein
MIYQVSYVVRGQKNVGKIEEIDHYPQRGETVELQGRTYRVVDTEELIKALSQFCMVHVVCEPLTDSDEKSESASEETAEKDSEAD